MVEEIFEPRPQEWGLPGDALLWDALEAMFEQQDWEGVDDIHPLLLDAYETLVGRSLTSDNEAVCVERFQVGGMSSGMISPLFWREEAFPLLTERFARLQEREDVLWWRRDGSMFYAIAEGSPLAEGPVRIRRLNGQHRDVSEASLEAHALSREEAGRRIAQLLLSAPATGRQQLQRLLDQVSGADLGPMMDMDAVMDSVGSFLEGTGLLRAVQGTGLRGNDSDDGEEDSAQSSPIREEFRATLGRFGAQLQRFGQRLQDLADEPPDEEH